MRVYHFTDGQYGLENIRRRRLKIATIEDLNDPFEMLGISLPVPAQRRQFFNFRSQMAGQFGVVSFSKAWNDPVQWSHYADKHRGMCLGFDIPDKYLITVLYKSKPYHSSVLDNVRSDDVNGEQLILDLIRTKYRHWAYEQEVRLISELNEADASGLYFVDFSEKVTLREVIVGHRANVSRHDVADALGALAASVTARSARLSFQSYRVVTQRNSALWK